MKIKLYIIFVQVFVFFIIAFLITGIIFSFIDGAKYSSLVSLFGAMIQGLCAIIVLLYAIYHDDWKIEKAQWPKLTIESVCYKGANDPNNEAISLIKDKDKGAVFDCEIKIHNNCNVHNINLKNKKHSKSSNNISNISCFCLNTNNNKKRHFYIEFEDDDGNSYIQKFEYFVINNNAIRFRTKKIKQKLCKLKNSKNGG